MKADTYKRLYSFIEKHRLTKPLNSLSYAITAAVFIFYPLFLLALFLNESAELPRVIIVPAVAFFVLSIARKIINAPRPFDTMQTPIKKAKGGKSFPSRHTFSAFMISFCMLGINTPAFFVLIVLSAILGVLRIVCGLHYIKDIIAGAALAAFSHFIGIIIF